MLPLLVTLSPDAAVLLLTLGIALVAVELNRPGWIVPGALGLLAILLAAAATVHRWPSALAILLLLVAAVILLLQLRVVVRFWTVLLGGAAGVCGLALLPGVSLPVAICCGLGLTMGTTVLTRIARRARKNKGLD
jgi:membrane-bound serine protease (ClpP class)